MDYLTANTTTGLYTGEHHGTAPADLPAGTEYVQDAGYVQGMAESHYQMYDFAAAQWVDNMALLPDYKAQGMTVINAECSRQIEVVAGWTAGKQSSFANGIYTSIAQKLQFQEDAMAALESSNVVQDAVEAAATYAAVDAAVAAVVWPAFPVPV